MPSPIDDPRIQSMIARGGGEDELRKIRQEIADLRKKRPIVTDVKGMAAGSMKPFPAQDIADAAIKRDLLATKDLPHCVVEVFRVRSHLVYSIGLKKKTDPAKVRQALPGALGALWDGGHKCEGWLDQDGYWNVWVRDYKAIDKEKGYLTTVVPASIEAAIAGL